MKAKRGLDLSKKRHEPHDPGRDQSMRSPEAPELGLAPHGTRRLCLPDCILEAQVTGLKQRQRPPADVGKQAGAEEKLARAELRISLRELRPALRALEPLREQ